MAVAVAWRWVAVAWRWRGGGVAVTRWCGGNVAMHARVRQHFDPLRDDHSLLHTPRLHHGTVVDAQDANLLGL